jgi:hypothetical protein
MKAKDVNTILSLPDAIRAHPTFPEVFALCKQWLELHYFDVHKLIVEERGHELFKALQFCSLKLWAGSGKLCVYNENDVAVALALWCENQILSEAECEELRALLRLKQLSPAFRQFVLPKLSFFRPLGFDIPRLGFAMSFDGGIPAQDSALPPAWTTAPARHKVACYLAERRKLQFSFSSSTVAGMINSAIKSGSSQSRLSPCLYFGGSFWESKVDFQMPVRALGVYLQLASLPPAGIPTPQFANADFSVSLQQSDGSLRKVAATKKAWFQGCGLGDRVVSSVASVNDVRGLFCEGHLVLQCTLKNVE